MKKPADIAVAVAPEYGSLALSRNQDAVKNSRHSGPIESEVEPQDELIGAIEMIHRHSSGVITFHRKVDGKFENLPAIRSEHVRRMLPAVKTTLESDAFLSINAYFDRESRPAYLSAARCRQPDRLRYLCACFADLDCYKHGLTPEQAIGAIVEHQDEGIIPPVSIIVRSGRGIWLLWLLRDASNPSLALRAWPEKVDQYRRLQTKIHESLAHLGADAQDTLRVMRVPGSRHSTTSVRVQYRVQADDSGNSFTYTLADLSARFALTPYEKPSRPASSRRLPSNRSHGPKALTEYRMNDFLALVQFRGGGFDKGCRNRATMYYAWLLRCKRIPKDEALERVMALGRRCRPPLSRSECSSAMKTGYSPNWKGHSTKRTGKSAPPSIRYQTVSDWLDITPRESELLSKYPPASRFGKADAKTKPLRKRRDARNQRWDAIRRIVMEECCVPSLRRMKQLLAAAGHKASHVTVKKDYESLGLNAMDSADAPKRARRRRGVPTDDDALSVKFQCL